MTTTTCECGPVCEREDQSVCKRCQGHTDEGHFVEFDADRATAEDGFYCLDCLQDMQDEALASIGRCMRHTNCDC